VDDRQLGKKIGKKTLNSWDLLLVCLLLRQGLLLIQLPLFGLFFFGPLSFHRPFRHSGRTSISIPKKKKNIRAE
jgi:hypothetical protein